MRRRQGYDFSLRSILLNAVFVILVVFDIVSFVSFVVGHGSYGFPLAITEDFCCDCFGFFPEFEASLREGHSCEDQDMGYKDF